MRLQITMTPPQAEVMLAALRHLLKATVSAEQCNIAEDMVMDMQFATIDLDSGNREYSLGDYFSKEPPLEHKVVA